MSFILEALKKSEQQRQEQNASQQKLRSRTLSLTSSQPGRRSYWLLAGFLSLVLVCGWWLYDERKPTLEPIPEPSLVASVPVVVSPAKAPEPAVTTPAPLASVPQQPVAAAEPAPVPSVYVSTPAVQTNTLAATDHVAPVMDPQRHDVVATERIEANAPATVVEPAQPRASDRMPFYLELSAELRDRMPHLAMSMHFYNSDPNRRLVRINDRLLREGDLVGRDLELVEITPTGVVLDFLGKTFELPGSKR